MCSYNMMNGVPTCGDPDLLNGVLRDQWKWPGFVVSDYDAWRDIFTTHGYTKTMEGAAAVGINAGLDQEGGGTLRARSHCRFVPPTHPLHTRITNIVGASISEATMRPNPTPTRASQRAPATETPAAAARHARRAARPPCRRA